VSICYSGRELCTVAVGAALIQVAVQWLQLNGKVGHYLSRPFTAEHRAELTRRFKAHCTVSTSSMGLQDPHEGHL
jgi:hypothetical protein